MLGDARRELDQARSETSREIRPTGPEEVRDLLLTRIVKERASEGAVPGPVKIGMSTSTTTTSGRGAARGTCSASSPGRAVRTSWPSDRRGSPKSGVAQGIVSRGSGEVSHGRNQGVGVDRLADVGGKAGLERMGPVLVAGVRGEGDGRDVPTLGGVEAPDAPHQREPVLSGHANVADQHIGLEPAHRREARGCRVSCVHRGARVGEGGASSGAAGGEESVSATIALAGSVTQNDAPVPRPALLASTTPL